MKKIYKYELEITEIQTVEMPVGAEILCVQFQDEALCLWV